MSRVSLLAVPCLAASLALAPASPGQEGEAGILKTLPTKTLEAILGDLGIEAEKSDLPGRDGNPVPGMYVYKYKHNNRETLLFYFGGKELMLQNSRPAVPLQKANDWNVLAHFSRAYNVQNKTIFEWNLDCEGGVTRGIVKQFFRRFDSEMKKFEQFLGAAINPKPEDPPPKGEFGARVPVQFYDRAQRQIKVTFPLRSKNPRTAWKVEWDIERRPVPEHLRTFWTQVKQNVYFRIKKASFQPDPKGPWIQVLNDARVSEFFVAYNDGKVRWYDALDHGMLWQIGNEDEEAGPNGQVLGKERSVVAEVRDRGPAYKARPKFGPPRPLTRRGQTFVLWANVNAGNYNYIVEYGFQDDGTVTFRCGATGRNLHLPGTKHDYPRMGHMHNTCWRLGMRLGPEGEADNANTAYLVKHRELPEGKGKADQVPALFNGGNEGHADWVATEFTRLRVENPGVNMGLKKEPLAYELVPLRQGTARHYGSRPRTRDGSEKATEEFTLHDFWVTREDSRQDYFTELPKYFTKLKEDGKQPGKVANTNLVLWYTSSILHDPRSEDGLSDKHNAEPTGPALVAWSGFELRPRNLFRSTPLYPPSK
jgi:hypothetical protein